MNSPHTLNLILSFAGLLSHVGLVVFALIWWVPGLAPVKDKIRKFIKDNVFTLLFMASFVAVLTSLLYSEVIGFEPCHLCWYQRIFLYPVLLLSGVALARRDSIKNTANYFLALLIPGGLIGLYQYASQMLPGLRQATNELLDCTANGAPSCTDFYFLQFGYITIPLLALTIFVVTIILILVARSRGRGPFA